jgi:hypothetical protein
MIFWACDNVNNNVSVKHDASIFRNEVVGIRLGYTYSLSQCQS